VLSLVSYPVGSATSQVLSLNLAGNGAGDQPIPLPFATLLGRGTLPQVAPRLNFAGTPTAIAVLPVSGASELNVALVAEDKNGSIEPLIPRRMSG